MMLSSFPSPFLLELGAGDRPYRDGRNWIHNDQRSLPDIEIVCNCIDIDLRIPHGSVDELRAAHLLEHFGHRETTSLLKRWRKIVKDGGSIHIEVPNLMWQANALANAQPDPSGRMYSHAELVDLIFGGQDYSGNFHFTGFTSTTLDDCLHEAGFDCDVNDIGQVLVATGVAI